MIAAIIIGHGEFGSSMLKTAEMIIGKQENIETIDFLAGHSVDVFDYNIEQKLSKLNTDSGVIVLADLMGGTPFNRMMVRAASNPSIKVIAGVNMPLVIELLTSRDNNKHIESFIKDIITNSKEGIVFGNELLAR